MAALKKLQEEHPDDPLFQSTVKKTLDDETKAAERKAEHKAQREKEEKEDEDEMRGTRATKTSNTLTTTTSLPVKAIKR